MTRSTIREDGKVTYRTSLFSSLPKAQAFAKCVSSNATRFESVLVHKSLTAKTDKWFVTFLPVNESRKDAIFQTQIDSRTARAESQEFIFWQAEETNVWWCFSVHSGETYEVTLFDCDCPDYVCRCQKLGIQCKHQIAWSKQKREGTLGQTDKKTRSEELAQLARRSMDINRDF